MKRQPSHETLERRDAPSSLLTIFADAPEQVGVGEEFDIDIFVRDNRESPPVRGAFSAFVDLEVEESHTIISAEVVDFSTLAQYEIVEPYFVDDIGGIDLSLQQPGEDYQHLARLRVLAPPAPGGGYVTLDTLPNAEWLEATLLGVGVVPPSMIEEIGAEWQVVGNGWHNFEAPACVNRDGRVDLLDAFAWLEGAVEQGIGPLPETVEEQTPALDVNDDGFASPVDLLIILDELFARAGEFPIVEPELAPIAVDPGVPVEDNAGEADEPQADG